MQEQLEAIEPGSFDGLQRYLAGRRAGTTELVVDNLVNRDFRRPSDFFNVRTLSLLAPAQAARQPLPQHGGYFDAPRLKSAFTFQDLYVGLSPFDAPATFSMLSYTELAHGVWYPSGGMYSIVETLVDLAREAGVEFRFGCAVSRIDTDANTAPGASASPTDPD